MGYSMTILIFLLVVVAISFILTKGAQYFGELADILDTVWNFITGNLFGFLILALCVFFLIMFIRKMDYSKLKPLNIRSYNNERKQRKHEREMMDYRMKAEKARIDSELEVSKIRTKAEQHKADKAFYESETQRYYSEKAGRR